MARQRAYYPVCLKISGGPQRFQLELHDDNGNGGETETFDPVTFLAGENEATLNRYRVDVDSCTEYDLEKLGVALFKATLGQGKLQACWEKIRIKADGDPVYFTLELDSNTDACALLPLELLCEPSNGQWGGFLFKEENSVFVRTIIRNTPRREWKKPKSPGLLFAWACPTETEKIPPETWQAALGSWQTQLASLQALDLQTTEFGPVTPLMLKQELRPGAYDYLVLLAHGHQREDLPGGVILGDTSPEFLSANDLAGYVANAELQLVLLCSCQTALSAPDPSTSLFSGVAQRMLQAVPCVVAMQANLPIDRSAELMGRFFTALQEGRTPTEATAYLRHLYYLHDKKDPIWSVPVIYARGNKRPQAPRTFGQRNAVAGRSARRAVKEGRSVPLTESDGKLSLIPEAARPALTQIADAIPGKSPPLPAIGRLADEKPAHAGLWGKMIATVAAAIALGVLILPEGMPRCGRCRSVAAAMALGVLILLTALAVFICLPNRPLSTGISAEPNVPPKTTAPTIEAKDREKPKNNPQQVLELPKLPTKVTRWFRITPGGGSEGVPVLWLDEDKVDKKGDKKAVLLAGIHTKLHTLLKNPGVVSGLSQISRPVKRPKAPSFLGFGPFQSG
jgi:hypothetical protein